MLIIYVLFISFMQLVNGVQFLNITPSFLSCASIAVVLSSGPVIFILPLANMYASL